MDSAGEVGLHPSIALDSSGFPHIAYFDQSNEDLKYALWNGASWEIEVIDSEGSKGFDPSLEIDSFGNSHISYGGQSGVYRELLYAHGNGSSWDIETVDSSGYSQGWYTSLELDTNGYPHISYAINDTSIQGVKYARWNGSSWQVDIIDSSGFEISLGLDNSDNPHISYISDNSELTYATWNGSSWEIEILETVKPGETSLAIDANGNPAISFWGPTETLKFAYHTPPTGIVEEYSPQPNDFLFTLTSNPIRGRGVLAFTLPLDVKVKIMVYNISGRLVSDIPSRNYPAGANQIILPDLASGVYMCQMESGSFTHARSFVITE